MTELIELKKIVKLLEIIIEQNNASFKELAEYKKVAAIK